MDAKSREQFETVAVWNDFTLFQSSADHFDVRKRTKPNSSWVKSGHGRRSSGLAYVGGVSGGLALGRKHFWEMHPTQIDISPTRRRWTCATTATMPRAWRSITRTGRRATALRLA
jgi:hypothetical protein